MMNEKYLSKSYWVEAMLTTVYLINWSPSMPLKGDVPKWVWTGKDASYQQLKMFGCLSYKHVAKDQRSKPNNKSKPCIFLGYSEDEFGYRLWDILDKKVVRSQDIVFMEDKTIEDQKQQKTQSSSRSTPITMGSGPVNPTQSADRRQLGETDESELVDWRNRKIHMSWSKLTYRNRLRLTSRSRSIFNNRPICINLSQVKSQQTHPNLSRKWEEEYINSGKGEHQVAIRQSICFID